MPHYAHYLVIFLILTSVTTPVLAQNRATPSPAASAKAAVQARLADIKLKACQNREAALQKRSDQVVRQATNMLDVFDKIATRVKTYYTETVIPSGKTVASYDTLLATIATKQEVVNTALTKAKTDATGFSCTGDGPKEKLAQFRTNMQSVKAALKEYRTAIKDLIVAVRSLNASPSPATATSPSTAPSATASPTTSPTP